MTAKDVFWSDDRVDTLRRCCADGLTMGQVARKLRTTRSAVAGKAIRLGLHFGGDTAPARGEHDNNVFRMRSAANKKAAETQRALWAGKKRPPRKPGLQRCHQPPADEGVKAAGPALPPDVAIAATPIGKVEAAPDDHPAMATTCRYIYGHTNVPGWQWCGHPTRPGLSYCPDHAAKLYTEPKPHVGTMFPGRKRLRTS